MKTQNQIIMHYDVYKTGVNKSYQMISIILLKKSVMWWKKLFFHLLDLALVSVQILQWKMFTKKFGLHKFMEESGKGACC